MKIYFFFFFLIFAQQILAQRCGQDAYNQSLKDKNLPQIADWQKEISQKQSLFSNAKTEGLIYKIPIIFHIIHNGEPVGEGTNISKAQIYSQLEVINQDFRRKNADSINTPNIFRPVATDTEIEFELAQIDTFGVPLQEIGIRRYNGGSPSWNWSEFHEQMKPKTIWNPKKYLNIWVTDIEGSFLGLGTFPLDQPDKQGIMIDYDNLGSAKIVNVPQMKTAGAYNLGRTCTHEIGHFLGLFHVWGNTGCTKTDCQSSDACNDTPTQDNCFQACQTGIFSCGKQAMVENYMQYSYDACMNLFTQDQRKIMRNVLETMPLRRELLTSDVAKPAKNGVYAFFEVEQGNCTDSPIRFKNKSISVGNAQILSYEWFFPNANPQTSTDENPQVIYPKSGNYDVTLTVKSNLNTSVLQRKQIISIQQATDLPSPLQENFEQGNFSAWKTDAKWQWANVGKNSQKSMFVANFLTKFSNAERKSWLITPFLNTSNSNFLQISFDLAYSIRPTYADSLEILLSTNCGASFKSIFKEGGANLATSAHGLQELFPNQKDWRNIQIFSNLTDTKNIKLALVNINGSSNNLYIDNLKIEALQAQNLPKSDFSIYPKLVIPNEKVFFQENSSNASEFLWKINNQNFAGRNVESVFPKIGSYEVNLTTKNPLGEHVFSEKEAIKVVDGIFLDQRKSIFEEIISDSDGYLTGTNLKNDLAKAEYYQNTSEYNLLQAIDVHFGVAKANTADSFVEIAVWNEQNNLPNQIIFSKMLKINELQTDLNRNRNTRMILENPFLLPKKFFIGVKFNNKDTLALYAIRKTADQNTAYELTAKNIWQTTNKSMALSVVPLLTKEIVNSLENEKIDSQIHVFPNPCSDFFNLQTNFPLKNVSIYNTLGQLILEKKDIQNSDYQIDTQNLTNGFYVLKLESNSDFWIKKLCIEK